MSGDEKNLRGATKANSQRFYEKNIRTSINWPNGPISFDVSNIK
jgi:hypothetical protein